MAKDVAPHHDLSVSTLLDIWNSIDTRNRDLGWSRYDYADLNDLPLIQSIGHPKLQNKIRRLLRGIDILAPIIFHRLLQVPKTIVPTAFYHVGLSYLRREQLCPCAPPFPESAADLVCETALTYRIPTDLVCWEHPYAAHASHWKTSKPNSVPLSCAHHVARLGILLLEVGLAHHRDDFCNSGISAAQALLQFHQWNEYSDGTCTVSYYPTTNDETINTCADVAAHFAMIPISARSTDVQTKLESITRMIVTEQNPDGSWFYCTKRHYANHADTPSIDHHHFSQVIQALARIYRHGNLDHRLQDRVRVAIQLAIRFYLERFCNTNGEGFYFPIPNRRHTHVVGYSEGIAAICWAIWSNSVLDEQLRIDAHARLSPLLANALQFYDPNTYDVASDRYLNHNYHIQSIRWGSGPLMECIMNFLCLMNGK